MSDTHLGDIGQSRLDIEFFDNDKSEQMEDICTLLHNTCINLQPTAIELLLNKQVDVNARNKYGATLLHYAVLYQVLPQKIYSFAEKIIDCCSEWPWMADIDLFELCVDGYSHNMANNDQLHYVKIRTLNINDQPVPPGEAEHVAVVTVLLKRGANPSARDLNGRTPLHIVACLGYEKIAEVLLKENSDPNAKDLYGVTPLREAVDNSHHAIVDLLLRNSAMVNAVDVLGESVMHAAVGQNNWPAVKSCMRYGAMVDIQNIHGNTPLHVVKSNAFRHMTYYLVKYGKANLNIRNWLGHTVLHDAVLRGQTAANFVEYLCKLGADPNIADNYGNTCLHDVAGFAIGNILICYAEEVNAKNKQGLTPLHFACKSSKPDSVWISRLLKEGAEVNACDGRGATPLHYLAKKANGEQHLTIFELFDTFNADFNIQTRVNQKTPLHLLCENSDTTNSLFDFVYSKSNPLMVDSLGRTWAHCIAESTGSWQSRVSVVNERSKDVRGWTPGFIRISTQLDKIQALLVNEQVSDTDNFGRTMLSLCSDSPLQNHVTNDENFPKFLELASHKDLMGRSFLHHWSLICSCSCKIDSNFLKEIVGEHINERDNFGRTPLYYATLYSRVDEFLTILLEAGADPTIGDTLDILPSEFAIPSTIPLLKPICTSTDTKVLQTNKIDRRFNPYPRDCALFYVKKKWENFQANKLPAEYDDFNTRCVTIFVQAVMSEVAKIDSRFESSQTLVGSAHQGTRASFPGDFDFLIELNTKNVTWHVEESVQFPGNVRLMTQNCGFDEFVDENRILQPDLLNDKLYCLLTTVICRPDVWKAGLFEPMKVTLVNKMKSPAITMTLFQNPLPHNGKVIFCRTEFSVDFVLTIRTDVQLPEDTPFSQFLEQNDYGSIDRSAYAIMKSPKYVFGGEQNGFCTMTFSLLETELISRSSAVIKAAYMMLVGVIPTVPARHPVQKYMLTTCLLSCIVNGKLNRFHNSQKTDFIEIFACLSIILDYVLKAVVNDAVESITCPGLILPVWDFEPNAKFAECYLKRFGISYVSYLKFNRQETDDDIRRNNSIGRLILNSVERTQHVNTNTDNTDNAMVDTILSISLKCRSVRDAFCEVLGMSQFAFDKLIDLLTTVNIDDDSSSLPPADKVIDFRDCNETDTNHFDKTAAMYDREFMDWSYDKTFNFCYSQSPFMQIGNYVYEPERD